jgi:glycosyltransferase involved in cell wall biosynthesis
MRIGIDMRMAGTGEGIGRYIEKLVVNLMDIDETNQYFLLCDKNSEFVEKFEVTRRNFAKVSVSSRYYSWSEQTSFIAELRRLKLDLVHFASFNAPVLYPGKFVITVHDVIHHQFPGKKKSRMFHRLAYRAAIWASVRRAAKVIAVSEATKREIVKVLGVRAEKVAVVYEGVEKQFAEAVSAVKIEEVKNAYKISKPFLFFVGVWRQYKNLPRLSLAFDILKEDYHRDVQLALAGKIDPFYPEIKQAVFKIKHADDIRALGFVPDLDLAVLYQAAQAFVLPSLVEGFGLIGVEAQAAGLPVLASRIQVLEEILGQGAIYFNPTDEQDMAKKIDELLGDPGLLQNLVAEGQINAQKYDWRKTAEETLKIYEQKN